jgi:hypothetical protein
VGHAALRPRGPGSCNCIRPKTSSTHSNAENTMRIGIGLGTLVLIILIIVLLF